MPPPPITYKTQGLELSDQAQERLSKKYADYTKKQKEALANANRFERFKAFITNKEVKSGIKNAGKFVKAGGDGWSKTFDPTSGQGGSSPVAEITGKTGDVVGAVTQFIETGVEIYNYKVKQVTAKTNRGIIKKAKEQDKQEDVIKDNIAKKLKEIQTAQKELQDAQRLLKVTQKEQPSLNEKYKLLETQAKEVERLDKRLKGLNDTIAQRGGVGSDFLRQQRDHVAGQLSAAKDARDRTILRVLDVEGPKVAAREKQLREVEETIKQRGGSNSFLDKQKEDLTSKLNLTKALTQTLGDKDVRVAELGETAVMMHRSNVAEKRQALEKLTTELGTLHKDLGELEGKGKIKAILAGKDLTAFEEDKHLENLKLSKALLDGLNSAGSVVNVGISSASGVSTAVAHGAKLGGGLVGVVAGPVTFVVSSKDFVTDVKANRTALKLKHKADEVLQGGIDPQDMELIAIAQRLRLKQKKQSVEKGISANKNFFGALGGIGTAASGAAAIAVIVGGTAAAAATAAAILTPVGWALAGAAAAAALAYGAYKLARHLNSQAIKAALKTTIEVTNGVDGTKKLSELKADLKQKVAAGQMTKKEYKAAVKALDKVADKLVKIEKANDKANGLPKRTKEEILADLSVEKLQNYSPKKLLARDTSVAAEALYDRFKQEVGAHLKSLGKDDSITSAELNEILKDYIKKEGEKPQANSAMGLLTKMGVGLKPEEATALYKDKSQSDCIKFMKRKVYSPQKHVSTREALKQGNGNGEHGQKAGANSLRARFKRQPQGVGSGGHRQHAN